VHRTFISIESKDPFLRVGERRGMGFQLVNLHDAGEAAGQPRVLIDEENVESTGARLREDPIPSGLLLDAASRLLVTVHVDDLPPLKVGIVSTLSNLIIAGLRRLHRG
jgi:hypothetical protein